MILLLVGCGSSKFRKQIEGWYNIRTIGLNVQDTTLFYIPSMNLNLAPDGTCLVPQRIDLPLSSTYGSKWELIKSNDNYFIKFETQDSLFDDPFLIENIEFYDTRSAGSNRILVKEFTLENEYVFLHLTGE